MTFSINHTAGFMKLFAQKTDILLVRGDLSQSLRLIKAEHQVHILNRLA
jgi:hypothetical protein